MFQPRYFATLVVLLTLSGTAPGCASSPRQRPVSVGDVETGPDSLIAARQQLAGHWTLVTLTIFDEGGQRIDVDATGSLTSDTFGGLTIEFRMSDAGRKSLEVVGIVSPNPVISTTGRAVIEPRQHQITYVGADFAKQGGLDAGLAAKRSNPFALERTRYYAFNADGTMTLATRHDNGRDASVSTWKRLS